MPRFIISNPPRSPKHERFVKRLATEIRAPGAGPQPLILEEEIPATKSRHVRVIWDQWKKLPDEERTDVILEAYTEAEGPQYSDQIALAAGLTGQEAFTLGYLPWRVRFAGSKKNGPSEIEIQTALDEEEKKTVLGPGSFNKHEAFFYPRETDAEEASRRLQKRLPHTYWSVSQLDFEDA